LELDPGRWRAVHPGVAREAHMQRIAQACLPQDVSRSVEAHSTVHDRRFQALLSAADWAALPVPIRKRFSTRLAGGDSVVYRGQVLETRMSFAGRWLAQAARLFGGPLPLRRDAGVPAVVTVTEDISAGGQHWTRLYACRDGFPQVIHSSKRFAGPTGLEEYVGAGLGVALSVRVEAGALVFCSAGYYLEYLGVRLRLPRWLTPGALTVTHRELGSGRFLFELRLWHPRFGEMIRQTAAFEETVP
jgi:uncharacterized protein DUF4166